jgi:uncharacterized repeat protein (TIGR01451 family)
LRVETISRAADGSYTVVMDHEVGALLADIGPLGDAGHFELRTPFISFVADGSTALSLVNDDDVVFAVGGTPTEGCAESADAWVLAENHNSSRSNRTYPLAPIAPGYQLTVSTAAVSVERFNIRDFPTVPLSEETRADGVPGTQLTDEPSESPCPSPSAPATGSLEPDVPNSGAQFLALGQAVIGPCPRDLTYAACAAVYMPPDTDPPAFKYEYLKMEKACISYMNADGTMSERQACVGAMVPAELTGRDRGPDPIDCDDLQGHDAPPGLEPWHCQGLSEDLIPFDGLVNSAAVALGPCEIFNPDDPDTGDLCGVMVGVAGSGPQLLALGQAVIGPCPRDLTYAACAAVYMPPDTDPPAFKYEYLKMEKACISYMNADGTMSERQACVGAMVPAELTGRDRGPDPIDCDDLQGHDAPPGLEPWHCQGLSEDLIPFDGLVNSAAVALGPCEIFNPDDPDTGDLCGVMVGVAEAPSRPVPTPESRPSPSVRPDPSGEVPPSGDPSPGDSPPSDTPEPPDLALTMTSDGSFVFGDVVRYTITVTNRSDLGTAAQPIYVYDQLPPGRLLAGTGTNWNCTVDDSGLASCEYLQGVPPGSSASPLVLEVQLAGENEWPTGSEIAHNCATVDHPEDMRPDNDTECVDDPVRSGSVRSPEPTGMPPASEEPRPSER